MTSLASFWCLYCYLWTYFTPSSSVIIVNFEQVNTGWVFRGWLKWRKSLIFKEFPKSQKCSRDLKCFAKILNGCKPFTVAKVLQNPRKGKVSSKLHRTPQKVVILGKSSSNLLRFTFTWSKIIFDMLLVVPIHCKFYLCGF